ncbi:MAG: serine/threonine protein kinase, partial [Synechococcaceae cyanobacterium RL_1_2]|nr:serine/threonine protein kinase [Synechococcaceae cyanobacterium RL_1_2]
MFLVQEYVQGLSLRQEIYPGQPWPQDQVVQFLLSTLRPLAIVHENRTIHRDIKPDNLMRRLKDQQIMLIDFGAVKEFTSTVIAGSTKIIGSPGYMAREQAIGKPCFASDIYSLGMVAIEALTGCFIGQLHTDPHTDRVLWLEELTRPIDRRLYEILEKMTAPKASDRYAHGVDALQVVYKLANAGSLLTDCDPSNPQQTPKVIASAITWVQKAQKMTNYLQQIPQGNPEGNSPNPCPNLQSPIPSSYAIYPH